MFMQIAARIKNNFANQILTETMDALQELISLWRINFVRVKFKDVNFPSIILFYFIYYNVCFLLTLRNKT